MCKLMTDIIQIKYNKAFAYVITICLCGFLIVINSNKTTDLRGILIPNILFGALTIYFFVKLFIPAVKEKVALELNDRGIYDYTRNQNTSWGNVIDINKIYFGRGNFGL